MSAPTKRPPLPSILIANDLLDGDVVFRTTDGWTRDPREAKVVNDEAGADALEAEYQQTNERPVTQAGRRRYVDRI